jgi:hypothetical protein
MNAFTIDPKVRISANELLNVVEESGLQQTSQQFYDALKTIANNRNQVLANIDVYYFNTPSESFWHKVSLWLGGQSSLPEGDIEVNHNSITYILNIRTFEQISSKSIGSIPNPLSVILIGQEDIKNPDFYDKLLALINDKIHVLFVLEKDVMLLSHLKTELSHVAASVEYVNEKDLYLQPLTERISNPEYWALLQLAYTYNCFGTLDDLNNFFTLIINQEERTLKAKKAIGQQQVIKIQTKDSLSPSDVLNNIKGLLNQQFSMVEKGINDNYENHLRPITGDYSKLIEEDLIGLTRLESSKKTKTMALSIPSDFETKHYDSIYNFFLQEGHEHMILLRDAFKSAEKEVDKLLEKNGITGVSLNLKFLTDSQLRIILDSAVRAERPYDGVMPKKGAYEYFVAMRKYQIIAVMLMSTLGMSFLKNMRIFMLPLTVVLLGAGGFSVYKTVQKESEEKENDEIEKAKDSLRSESKRIASEVARQWLRVINDHLKMQLSQTVISLESYIKNYATKKQVDDEDEKKKVQRQVQSIDNNERKMANINRLRDTFYRNLQKNKMDSRQAFSLAIKKVVK